MRNQYTSKNIIDLAHLKGQHIDYAKLKDADIDDDMNSIERNDNYVTDKDIVSAGSKKD